MKPDLKMSFLLNSIFNIQYHIAVIKYQEQLYAILKIIIFPSLSILFPYVPTTNEKKYFTLTITKTGKDKKLSIYF